MVERSLNYGRDIVAAFVRDLDVKVGVDLGPGLGDDLRTTKTAHPKARLVGLEVHAPYAASLRSAGFEVIEANIECEPLPFDPESVDLIVANQVFEHIKEVFWVLHECSRVLRVGGSLVIGVPNLASLHNRVLLAIGKQPTSMTNWSAHVRGYTRPDLVALINQPFPDGFSLVRARGANFYPFPGPIARALARAWPGGAWGLFGRFEKRRQYDNSYLRWPAVHQLETNFYLGPEEGPSAAPE